jgi:acyl-CoA thioester hydrolase
MGDGHGPDDVASAPFEHRIPVRYLEADQQGVVFNMWYLAYFDDAMTALLARGGVGYAQLMADGTDMQLVHSEIDWSGPLRYGDDAVIDVAVRHLGTTSFTLGFTVRGAEGVVATGKTVYVVVATDGSGKQSIPAPLRGVLEGARAPESAPRNPS